jgi:hypothetical protein
MFGYFAGTLCLFFINLYWKISIHTMGIAGPATVLIFVFLTGACYSDCSCRPLSGAGSTSRSIRSRRRSWGQSSVLC